MQLIKKLNFNDIKDHTYSITLTVYYFTLLGFKLFFKVSQHISSIILKKKNNFFKLFNLYD